MFKPFTGNSHKSETAYVFIKIMIFLDATDDFMQKHHSRLTFCAVNIVVRCIWMNTVGNFGFMQNKVW